MGFDMVSGIAPSSGQDPDCQDLDASILPGLPNDLAMQCLVRVPRRSHATLALVCRQWKLILLQKEYYMLRKQMGLAEGWVYVLSRDRSEVLHWYALDPVERKWMELPAMPGDRVKHYGMASEVLGTQLYVLGGGKKYQHPTCDVIKYNPVTNQWKETVEMETARCYFICTAFDGQLYAVGGMGTTSGTLTSWEVYDPSDQCWASFEDPNIVPDLGEVLVLDKKIYIRHICPNVFPPSYAAVYNSVQNTWATLDDEMTKKWCGPASVAGNDVYMLDQTYGLKLMVLDKESLSWNSLGRLSPISVKPPCRITVVGRNLFVVGRGLKTIVLNVDRAGSPGGFLLTSSIQGLEDSDNTVLSCHVLYM